MTGGLSGLSGAGQMEDGGINVSVLSGWLVIGEARLCLSGLERIEVAAPAKD